MILMTQIKYNSEKQFIVPGNINFIPKKQFNIYFHIQIHQCNILCVIVSNVTLQKSQTLNSIKFYVLQ